MQVFDHAHPWSGRVIAAVVTGGAVGAVARWIVFVGVERIPAATDTDWPWALLVVNVAGALLIGSAAARVGRDTVAWSFVATGVLGGFTTMSALAVELNDLAEQDRTAIAVAYALVTLAAGSAAVVVGERLADRRRIEPGDERGAS